MLSYPIILHLLIATVFAQDALLSPDTPFLLQHSHPAPSQATYLLEIDPASYSTPSQHIHSRYSSPSACPHLELTFHLITKMHPQHAGRHINQCQFEGESPVVCKVDIAAMNPHHHLLKMTLQNSQPCNATLQIAVTPFAGEGQSSHFLSSGDKVWVMAKMLAWFIFTMVLILFAIRVAVRLVDSFDKPPKPVKEVSYEQFKQKPKGE